MSHSLSLRSRVKRLEKTLDAEQTFGIGDRLQRALDADRRMTGAERAAKAAEHRADCIAALAEPDAVGGITARLQRARRRCGSAYLQEQTRQGLNR